MCYKQLPSSVTVYSARPTKCGLTLYIVTIVRESKAVTTLRHEEALSSSFFERLSWE